MEFKEPSFSDVLEGRVIVDGTGSMCRTIFTKYAKILVPVADIEILTHLHYDHISPFTSISIVPASKVYEAKLIFHQFGLKKSIIPWKKFKETFHYCRGAKAFSSTMEFENFAVIGESAMQRQIFSDVARVYPSGIVVRTPKRDTLEQPLTAREVTEKDWLFADPLLETTGAKILPKASTTLREMILNEKVLEAVKSVGFVRLYPTHVQNMYGYKQHTRGII